MIKLSIVTASTSKKITIICIIDVKDKSRFESIITNFKSSALANKETPNMLTHQ